MSPQPQEEKKTTTHSFSRDAHDKTCPGEQLALLSEERDVSKDAFVRLLDYLYRFLELLKLCWHHLRYDEWTPATARATASKETLGESEKEKPEQLQQPPEKGAAKDKGTIQKRLTFPRKRLDELRRQVEVLYRTVGPL